MYWIRDEKNSIQKLDIYGNKTFVDLFAFTHKFSMISRMKLPLLWLLTQQHYCAVHIYKQDWNEDGCLLGCSLVDIDRRFRRAYCLQQSGQLYQTTRCNIPEDSRLHTRRRETTPSLFNDPSSAA
jgi:hypothetical protein